MEKKAQKDKQCEQAVYQVHAQAQTTTKQKMQFEVSPRIAPERHGVPLAFVDSGRFE